MLARKQSVKGGTEPILADYGPDESFNESADIDWVNKVWVRRILRLCALLCLISVSLNTTKTFEKFPSLVWITFGYDIFATLLFSSEVIAKIRIKGLMISHAPGDTAYLRDRWCQFDATMAFFLWVSVLLQCFEVTSLVEPSYFSMIRAPRPLIMIRFIRVFLKFSMPKSRINQIFKRSSQQIYNVTLFFLFFMSLYGLLGVQFFGRMAAHCVRNGTDPRRVTLDDLAMPDHYCSNNPDAGYSCPHGLVCMELELPKSIAGFAGFDDFAHSFFTVYQAASPEGWALLMYQAVDSLPAWRATFYFTTMIFFLAWLVKNVFIAVITETFNEIRVQFQQMWGERVQIHTDTTVQVLRGDDSGWKLVTVNEGAGAGAAPRCLQRLIHSAAFQIIVMLINLANAFVAASVRFVHDGRPREEFFTTYYYAEIGFTLFFDLEVLMKIWCLGFKGYIKRSLHKLEFLLAIGTTIHIIPQFFASELTYFQVLRIVRLIKASPVLEDFVYKIFGPGKKLGSLIIFTMCLLLITSAISMQLFCCLKNFSKFETFPEAFMSMFQILTQEGWVEVMNETMLRTSSTIGPIVAVYFILYHLFVSLIVLSLFVAVILDNLELDEDIKKLKQLKAREQSAGITEGLPIRLRLFEKFADSPQMTRLHRMPSEFGVPKVRESFMKQFAEELQDECPELRKLGEDQANGVDIVTYRKKTPIHLLNQPNKVRVAASTLRRVTVTNIIMFSRSRSMRRSVRGGSVKVGGKMVGQAAAHAYSEHMKENGGEIGRSLHDFDIKMLQQKRQQAEMKRNQREEDLRENHPYFDTPLLIVGRESKFRKLCQRIVYARYDPRFRDPVTGQERKIKYKTVHNLLGLVTYLDWAMIMVTTISCISMMLETPHQRVMNTPRLQIAEYVFVVCMSVELLLKTLADGLLFTPKALVRDAAGVMDVFVYTVSLIFICWLPEKVPPHSPAHLLLLLRCVRPLRIFSLVPHMRRVVYELCRGFKEILLVSILLIVLIFVFACYGVHLFGGRLARCNDPSISLKEDCRGVFERSVFVTRMKLQPAANSSWPKLLVPRIWANPRRFHFDNIGNAMLALFEVLSYKGWLDIRDVLIHRLGPAHSIFIHLYVFLGCMIGLTLFVGVVIANYSENKGTALLTVDQRRWCDLKKRLKIAQPLHLPPRPDTHRFRAFIYDITQQLWFKRLIAIMVLANSSLLCVSWGSDETHTVPLATVSAAFTILFGVEVIMKLIAFTPRGYWQSGRNRYDLFVTCLGIGWVALHFSLMNATSNTIGFVIVILRFFTITGKHATLRMLMLTVVVSVYKSFFIIMGMFLLIFFYACTGVILFGNVKQGEHLGRYRHASFHTAPSGIALLFRIVTGEDWNKIMHDAMVSPPYCTVGENYWETDCGSFTGALIFFCSFYVMITYIVLNLLVAIIMENFSLFYSNEEDALLSYADIRNFQNTWNMVDTQQRGLIPIRRVKFVLGLLKGRLEVDPEKDRLLFKHMCYEMERLHNGEDVTFHDVLNMLSYRSVDIRKALQLEELLAREELEYLIEEEVAKQTIREWLDKCLRRIKHTKAQEETNLLHSLRVTNEPLLATLQVGASPGALQSTLDLQGHPLGLSPHPPHSPGHEPHHVGGEILTEEKEDEDDRDDIEVGGISSEGGEGDVSPGGLAAVLGGLGTSAETDEIDFCEVFTAPSEDPPTPLTNLSSPDHQQLHKLQSTTASSALQPPSATSPVTTTATTVTTTIITSTQPPTTGVTPGVLQIQMATSATPAQPKTATGSLTPPEGSSEAVILATSVAGGQLQEGKDGIGVTSATSGTNAGVGGILVSGASSSGQQPQSLSRSDTPMETVKQTQQQQPSSIGGPGKKRVGIHSDSITPASGALAAAGGRKFLIPGPSSVDKHLTPAEKDQRDKERSYTTLKKWSSAIGKGLPEVSESSELATTPGTDGDNPLMQLQQHLHLHGPLDDEAGGHLGHTLGHALGSGALREPGGGVKFLKAVVGEVHEWWNVLLQNNDAHVVDSDSDNEYDYY
ncbi:sodium leak channel non-selective protein-like isoform X3 [Varroa destructor]|uniref:Sodium leak channel NALCN n=1 Tax=Varroa destructor TaxID=109461 RepID=A0A7M7K4J8_VARDE|nr:sodium leak channel non-selective protein-like isoform X3 [Varroa destructor]